MIGEEESIVNNLDEKYQTQREIILLEDPSNISKADNSSWSIIYKHTNVKSRI